MTAEPFAAPVETLRKRVQEATQRLLGDTIGIAEADWYAPSRLPGWSRANVAAHLAANADGLARLIEAAGAGTTAPLYPDAEARRQSVEVGAELSALDLQISLDTSAGRLERAMDAVEDWTAPAELLGRPVTLAQVPLARLSEVVLHHLDLDCDLDVSRLDTGPARWLLQWAMYWHGADDDLPALVVHSSSGVSGEVGRGGAARTVSGDDAELWGWLMGRTPADRLTGADGVQLALRS